MKLINVKKTGKALCLLLTFAMIAGKIEFVCMQDYKVNAADTEDEKSSEAIEKALEWAIEIANDDSHGYSQLNRQGPDYDCSSFVINALKQAGISTGIASYTGNMRSELVKCGFSWIPWKLIGNTSDLMRGDILLREGKHTEFYLGNNQNVGAHGIYEHPEEGDQTGREICVGDYWFDNWDGILRFDPDAEIWSPPVNSEGYFPSCSPVYLSIVEALNSVGADSSLEYRKKIAAENGIAGYSGTAEQNILMLDLLKAGILKMPDSDFVPDVPPVYDDNSIYFTACDSDFLSIVDALKSIGVDFSFSNRKRIAEKNNISGYTGTAEQNNNMLNLLKCGELLNPDISLSISDIDDKYYPACSSEYSSLVDALKSIDVDSSFMYRKKIAAANNISEYSGTATQNIKMLELLKNGKLVCADFNDKSDDFNYYDVLYGDINQDEVVDLMDLSMLSQHLLKDIILSEKQLDSADCYYDGEVDIIDIALLKQFIMKDSVTLGPE